MWPSRRPEERFDGVDCSDIAERFRLLKPIEPWKAYQQQAADFFASLGYEAQVNAKIQGVRAAHSVDVWVTFELMGFEHHWVVECKHWQSKVSKEKVLALRSLVDDVGANAGILLTEAGFQPGAKLAAARTNLLLTSLENLYASARRLTATLEESRTLHLLAGEALRVVIFGRHAAVGGLLALPDSGAEITFAPESIARAIGIDLTAAPLLAFTTAGGEVRMRKAEVELGLVAINGSLLERWQAPVAFSDSVLGIVLGREGSSIDSESCSNRSWHRTRARASAASRLPSRQSAPRTAQPSAYLRLIPGRFLMHPSRRDVASASTRTVAATHPAPSPRTRE